MLIPGDSVPGVGDGVERAKFYSGLERAALTPQRQVVMARVHLQAVANRFLGGHRVWPYISSTRWPHFDVNARTTRHPSADWQRRSSLSTTQQNDCES